MAINQPVKAQPSRPTISLLLISIVSAVVVAVAIFAIVHLAFAPAPPNAGEQTVAHFYSDVQKQDYAHAYQYFAGQQQAIIAIYSFELSAKALDTQYGPVTAYHEVRYDRDTNDASQGTIQESVSRSKRGNYTVSLQVQQQHDKSWKILSESGV